MFNDRAWDHSLTVARGIHENTGFWPSLDDIRLDAWDCLFWVPIEDVEPLDELIGRQRQDDPATRVVVGAVLRSLLREHGSDAAAVLGDAFTSFLQRQSVRDISDVAMLRWELHAAGAGGSLTRVLEVGHRLDEVGAPPDVLSLVASTAFLLIHPSIDQPPDSAFLDPDIRHPEWPGHAVYDFSSAGPRP